MARRFSALRPWVTLLPRVALIYVLLAVGVLVGMAYLLSELRAARGPRAVAPGTDGGPEKRRPPEVPA